MAEPEAAAVAAAPFYGRIEMPGWRQHTGYITEETRYGQAAAVVRDAQGREAAVVYPGPGCRIVPLIPGLNGDARAAITGPDDGGFDDDPWHSAPDDVVEVVVHSATCEGGDCEGECDG